jgi:adenosylcobinamide-phosphate synthase
MKLIALVAAVLLEQWRPLKNRRYLLEILARVADKSEHELNAGRWRHGVLAWSLVVAPATLLLLLLYLWLERSHVMLGVLLSVLTLYLTMGFRQFSHYFTRIRIALSGGDTARAQLILAEWRGRASEDLSANEIARIAIEEALAASHHRVFAVLFWFLALGPAGALLYRLAWFLRDRWVNTTEGEFGAFAGHAFHVINWLPARLTAISFAVTGDFEDAVYCWRTQAANWRDSQLGIVLAAGAGAIGVQLGMPLVDASGAVQDRPQLGLGDFAEADHMGSTAGLMWRALVLWFFLIVLVLIARQFGGG